MKRKITIFLITVILLAVLFTVGYFYIQHLIRIFTFTNQDWLEYRITKLERKALYPSRKDIPVFLEGLYSKNDKIRYISLTGLSRFDQNGKIKDEIHDKLIEYMEDDKESDRLFLSRIAYVCAKKFAGEKTKDSFKKMIYSMPDTSYKYLLGCFYLYILTRQKDFFQEIERLVSESPANMKKKYLCWITEFANTEFIPVIKKYYLTGFEPEDAKKQAEESIEYISKNHHKLWQAFDKAK